MRHGKDVPRQIDLAHELGMSQSEIVKSLRRCTEAGLLDPHTRQTYRHAFLEFAEHGLKYIFPAKLGGPTRGMPTAWAAPVLSNLTVASDEEKPVWPLGNGTSRGVAVRPLYPSVPQAVAHDVRLYGAIACLDLIRLGRVRERKLAVDELKRLALENK